MINDLTDFEEAMFENDFGTDDISEPKKPRMPKIPENLTMLSAMNWLYKASKDSQLSDKFLKKAKKATSFIQDRMDITPAQATLLSIIVGESTLAGSCRNQNISRHLNCDAYQTLGLMNDLKALNVAHLTHMASEMNCIRYKPVKTVINSIRDNKAIEKRQLDNLSFDDFFTELRHIIKMASDSPGEVETENLMEEISDLMKRNRQLCFCRKFNDYVPNDMTLRLTFIYYCSHLVNWGRDEMVLRHTSLDNLLDDFSYTKLEKSLANGTCALIANGLMECSCEDGMCGNAYRITDKARTNLLPEYKSTGKVSKNILMPEDITPKQLFFNVEDQKQIDTLYSLLSQENFDSVTGRLEQAGMRKGICIRGTVSKS